MSQNFLEKTTPVNVDSFNQTMNSVSIKLEETSKVSKHLDRFIKDFERIKDQMACGTSDVMRE